MNKRISKYLILCICVLSIVSWWQQRRIMRMGEERDRHRRNSEALLSEMKRIQVDSATMAIDVKSLRMTLEEYKRFRSEDAEKIRQLGVRLKNLTAAARHDIEISGAIEAVVRDTAVIHDSQPEKRKKIEMVTPHIELRGLIENDRLKGHIRIPVRLQQALWIEYKRRWLFWKRVKAVHQIISSDNPYVQVVYSEYIEIPK